MEDILPALCTHSRQRALLLQPSRKSPGLLSTEIQGTAGPGIILDLPRQPGGNRILDHVADGRLEIRVIRNSLVVNGQAAQFVAQAVPTRDGDRSLPDILMDESVARVETAIKDKVQVIVHQAESQDDDTILQGDGVNPVHRGDKVLPVPEQDILGGAVGGEMPAVANGVILPFYDGEAYGQVLKNVFHNPSL